MSGYDHLSRSSPGGSRTFVALGFGLFMVAVLIGVVSFNRSKAVKSGFGAGLAGRWFLDAERPVDLLGWWICGLSPRGLLDERTWQERIKVSAFLFANISISSYLQPGLPTLKIAFGYRLQEQLCFGPRWVVLPKRGPAHWGNLQHAHNL